MNKLSYRDCLLKNIPSSNPPIVNPISKFSPPVVELYYHHPNDISNHPNMMPNMMPNMFPNISYGMQPYILSPRLPPGLIYIPGISINLPDPVDLPDPANFSDLSDEMDDVSDMSDLSNLSDDQLLAEKSCILHGDDINRKYSILDQELNKIRALSSFKNILVEHLIKYFRSHKMYNNGKLKYIRTQMYNHFPNWYFNLNNKGQIVDFLPIAPLEIQENLDYIFKDQRIEKRNDFDPKLLLFNTRYIRDKLVTLEIIRSEYYNLVKYELNTNYGNWKLLYITKQQEANLKSRYNGPVNAYDQYVAIMLLRYKFLGGLNNHLSIPPVVYQYLGIDMELFGSPFNVSVREYASPFPDVEKFFGSQGSFNQISLKSNRSYAANPPYDVKVVLQMAQWLYDQLGRSELNNVVIYLTLPLWRKDFPGYQILRDSQWFRDEAELGREDYPFLHYFRGKLIPASDTYLMILSTNKNVRYNCRDVMKKWPQIRSNFLIDQKLN